MVTFLTVTLAVSFVALMSLLILKRFELATGRRVFARLRPRHGGFIYRIFFFIERTLPAIIRYFLVMSFRFVRGGFHRLIAWIVLHVERSLERILHTVRERTTPTRSSGEASSFLRAVADHKRTLLHSSAGKRAIFDE